MKCMTRPTTLIVLLVLFNAATVCAQTWTLENDEDEDFAVFLKPTDDPTARRVRHDVRAGETVDIQYAANSRYFLMLRSKGGGIYRLSRPIDFGEQGSNTVSQIVSPVKNRNGRIKRDQNGNIVYAVMNQDGFFQDKDYERLIDSVRQSTWNSEYQAIGGSNQSSTVVVNGNAGTYAGRNGKWSNIYYTANEDTEAITINGDWSWGQGGGHGSFYLNIDRNNPNAFSGEYWEEGKTTRYSWTGNRAGNR